MMKGNFVMAEFGENIKRIREEKGLTQQTLADNLYVTRQAVSRWEGGSRYPDLMTAKKMAQFLGVTLDELLTDDDMQLYVQRNEILESSFARRLQTELISLAFMSAIILSVIYLCNYFLPNGYMIASGIEMAKHLLLAVVFLVGLYLALKDKLNPKMAIVVIGLFAGVAIVTGVGVIAMLGNNGGMQVGLLAGMTWLNLFFLLVCIRFFNSKKIISPIPLYITTGVYALAGIINSLRGIGIEYPVELRRDMVMLNIFSFVEAMLVLTLVVCWAYVLDKKRRLAGK